MRRDIFLTRVKKNRTSRRWCHPSFRFHLIETCIQIRLDNEASRMRDTSRRPSHRAVRDMADSNWPSLVMGFSWLLLLRRRRRQRRLVVCDWLCLLCVYDLEKKTGQDDDDTDFIIHTRPSFQMGIVIPGFFFKDNTFHIIKSSRRRHHQQHIKSVTRRSDRTKNQLYIIINC